MSGYDIKKFDYFAGRDLAYSFDCLTGVLLREEIVEYINYLLSRGRPFSFALVDIDNFKTVNDTLGHINGDKVLKKAAEYLCGKVGEEGVVGRFGGDEFMLVLGGTADYRDVWNLGHEINMNIGGLRFEGLKGVSITFTMGISRSPVDGDTYESLLALADKALYRGKMKGRNCFIIYLPEKHRDIDITKAGEKKYTSMYLCSRVFMYLTESENIEDGLNYLFRHFAAYFMVDHICVETRGGLNFQVIHKLSKNRNFSRIDYDGLKKYFNNIGLASFNKVEEMCTEEDSPVLREMLGQHISSALYCKVAAFGTEYGYIRVDMTDTVRIWQPSEKDIIVIMANAIGILLHYQGKTLAGLHLQEAYITGQEA